MTIPGEAKVVVARLPVLDAGTNHGVGELYHVHDAAPSKLFIVRGVNFFLLSYLELGGGELIVLMPKVLYLKYVNFISNINFGHYILRL